MMRIKIYSLYILFIISFSVQLSGQDNTMSIPKINSTLNLDGKLDDSVWKEAPIADQFQMNYPYDSIKAKSQTEVKVLFDDKFLYIGATCYHHSEKDYVVQSLKRDFSFEENDAFAIYIDAYNDQNSGLGFAVNPHGTQLDGLISRGGTKGITTTWDGLWYAEVDRNHYDLWTVEIAIPFKTLRFVPQNNTWRINFARNDLKRNEISTWAPIPRGFDVTNLAYLGFLEWESMPKKSSSNIAIIPYLATGFVKDYTSSDNKIKANNSVGVDTKIALSSSLNLDLTINPDFSQVEVDQQIIDLQRFELFFPEKRVFFLENSDIFSGLGNSRVRPFFSRRIGSAQNQRVKIHGGARLSGNINKNWRVGLMSVHTDSETTDTLTKNYSVAVVQRKISNGSSISGFMSNRQSFDHSSVVDDFNRIGGIELDYRSKNSKLSGKSFAHYSWTKEKLKNSLSYSSKLRYTDSKLTLFAGIDAVGENYIPDMGFVPRLSHSYSDTTYRIAYKQIRSNGHYRFFMPKSDIIDFVGPDFHFDLFTDATFNYQEHALDLQFIVQLLNGTRFKLIFSDYSPILYFPFTISGLDRPFQPGNYHNQSFSIKYDSGKRSRVYGAGSLTFGGEYMGNLLSLESELNYRHQHWGVLGITFSQQNLTGFPEVYGESNFTLIGSKLELSFNRSLFFTTFLQYNTQNENFNINSRFNWRFRPLSDLYIVYTENYSTDNIGIKDRALVLKLTYWFNL